MIRFEGALHVANQADGGGGSRHRPAILAAPRKPARKLAAFVAAGGSER
jgi:hypothetical protein